MALRVGILQDKKSLGRAGVTLLQRLLPLSVLDTGLYRLDFYRAAVSI